MHYARNVFSAPHRTPLGYRPLDRLNLDQALLLNRRHAHIV